VWFQRFEAATIQRGPMTVASANVFVQLEFPQATTIA
jgi:hypothetical protein